MNFVLGITKKYQDIKTISYQVTFHQILRSFELDKSAPAMLSTVPGFPIELDFPDFNMKEFVKFVKNFQMTENIDDVRHLWIQVKTWLSAMKPPYDSTTNYVSILLVNLFSIKLITSNFSFRQNTTENSIGI